MARLFVAVDLAADVRAALQATGRTLARVFDPGGRHPLRLVHQNQMHLTLAFLGEVVDSHVPAIVEVLRPPFPLSPFDLSFGACGVFPARGPAGVAWVGVLHGADVLAALHAHVVARLSTVGIPRDTRRFTPHVTVGRWRERSGPVVRPTLPRVERVPSQHVASVTLFHSRLLPQGAEHTPLAVTPLAPASSALH